MPATTESQTVAFIRRALFWILVLGLVGTEVELFLLKHTDGAQQLIPIVLLGVAIAVVAWHGLARNGVSVRAQTVVMAAVTLAGALGVILHFRGNLAFELEQTPDLSGAKLFWMVITGATPTLAPGAMLQLGLIGLAYAYRHPALRPTQNSSETLVRTHPYQ
jgi:hypothetical protein